MASVTLSGVKKDYPGGVTAVHRSDLYVRDREFMVLVGPSGCGKTTTLRMIAGLEEVTEGTVHIGDRLVNNVHPKNRNIAMVFQNFAIYPHMTTYDNMAFGLRQRKFPKADIDRRVRQAAGILNIAHLLDRKPRALSGGERQRVAVGRAIVRQPDVFLFDEPLSNLDAKLRVEMRKELKLLHQRLQTTIIYVTHDQLEAMTLGDRICVMRDGWIEQIARPLEVYEKPRTRFVAGFVGTPPMNFIKGSLAADGGNVFFRSAHGRYQLPSRFGEFLQDARSREVEFGIRPEDLAHSSDAPEGEYIPGVVQIVEALGNEQLVYLKTGETTVVARRPAHQVVKPGDEQRLVAQPDMIHLFDAESGENLTSA